MATIVYNISNNSTVSSPTAVEINRWDDLSLVLRAYVPFALDIDKYVTPVWCAIGIIGNIVSAKVWLLRRMRKCNTSASYLTALAIADITFLILHIFYELQYPWHRGALDLQGWCQVWNVLYIATQYICMLLVLAFTVERFLSVCHPFECERFSRSSRSPKVIVLVLVASFVLSLPQGYFWHIGPNTEECQARENDDYQNSSKFYIVWNWTTEMVMFALVPIIVLVLNICVLRQIKSVGKLYVSDSDHRTANVRCTATTVTLLWISFYLIFTKLPVTIVYALQTSVKLGQSMPLDDMGNDCTWQSYFSYFASRKIVEEIALSHHACNVFIYCATSRQFRRHFKAYYGSLACSTMHSECELDPPQPLQVKK
ncbi:probable G-protein coupled receptor B0563.6 [Haliotis asinina]|uniref:probable G-protein coupled receptor B0563.6 n=1 Tax=Haliotis asinina TaxID=109174 RepID=UPI0035326976